MDWGEDTKDKSWRKSTLEWIDEIKATKTNQRARRWVRSVQQAGHTKAQVSYQGEMQLKCHPLDSVWHQQLQWGGEGMGEWDAIAKPGCEQPRIQQPLDASEAWGGKCPHIQEEGSMSARWTWELLICKCGQKADTLKSSPAEIINHRFTAAVIFSRVTERPKLSEKKRQMVELTFPQKVVISTRGWGHQSWETKVRG